MLWQLREMTSIYLSESVESRLVSYQKRFNSYLLFKSMEDASKQLFRLQKPTHWIGYNIA